MAFRFNKIKWGSGLIFLFLLVVARSTLAGVPQDSHKILSLKEKDILVSAVHNYYGRIHDYHEDVLRLRSDREWLEVKIKRIEDEKRTVPATLTSATRQIDLKLSQHHLEIERMTSMTEKHLSDLRVLDAKVTAKNGNRVPGWWSFDEWVYHLMYPDKIMAPKTTAPSMEKKDSHAYLALDSELRNDLEQKIEDIELDNWVALIEDESGLALEVQLPILFGLGKSNVAKDYIPFFKKLAWLVKPYPIHVEVSGYSDGEGGNGMPFPARMALGANRAANVVQELLETGLQPDIFKVIGDDEYGASDPEKKNLSAAMKRRVEIRVYFKKDRS